ncbi:hypothetical protein Pfo_016308 [Paulownia fortunei]|nr:hypothetical protein Pfo_016308 [Paulownia fortunei]
MSDSNDTCSTSSIKALLISSSSSRGFENSPPHSSSGRSREQSVPIEPLRPDSEVNQLARQSLTLRDETSNELTVYKEICPHTSNTLAEPLDSGLDKITDKVAKVKGFPELTMVVVSWGR